MQDTSAGNSPIVGTHNAHAWATWTSEDKSFILTEKNVTEETLRKPI